MSDAGKKRVRKLFARFNAIYGGTWSARFTTAAMFSLAVDEWASELEHYSDAELEQGYKLCKQRYTLAPTLPQFLELVKLAHYRKGASAPPQQDKPIGPGAKETAMRYIAEMRARLSEVESVLSEDEPREESA